MSKRLCWILIGLFCHASSLCALTFPIAKKSDIVGKIQHTIVQRGESLADIGRRFDMGIYELIEANPNLDPWYPKEGTKVLIPSQFILPPGSRHGMVLNLAEMRLYFYDPKQSLVSTYPIGIGKKQQWATPLGNTTIIQKTKHPEWRPPQSIRDYHLKRGKVLPSVVPAGPENPLGDYAFRLALPGYLIHGTNRPGGIGVRTTSGCIRLFPEDIETLFYRVPVGTAVRIIHKPYKLGWDKNQLYLEAHEPLSDEFYEKDSFYELKEQIKRTKNSSDQIDWSRAKSIFKNPIGYPTKLY